jgi:hypothetical protein
MYSTPSRQPHPKLCATLINQSVNQEAGCQILKRNWLYVYVCKNEKNIYIYIYENWKKSKEKVTLHLKLYPYLLFFIGCHVMQTHIGNEYVHVNRN